MQSFHTSASLSAKRIDAVTPILGFDSRHCILYSYVVGVTKCSLNEKNTEIDTSIKTAIYIKRYFYIKKCYNTWAGVLLICRLQSVLKKTYWPNMKIKLFQWSPCTVVFDHTLRPESRIFELILVKLWMKSRYRSIVLLWKLSEPICSLARSLWNLDCSNKEVCRDFLTWFHYIIPDRCSSFMKMSFITWNSVWVPTILENTRSFMVIFLSFRKVSK